MEQTKKECIVICTPVATICRVKLPIILEIAEKNGVECKILDVRDLKTIEEMQKVQIHGLPEVRYGDKEIFGDISRDDLETLFATDL